LLTAHRPPSSALFPYTTLFRSVPGFNDSAILAKWCYNFAPGTPDGPKCHSVQVDPVNPKRMILGLSGGGLFLSEDQGGSWRPVRSEEHTSELQSRFDLVCRLLL